jgi:hypothetical protein
MSNVNFPSAMQERVALAGCTVRIGGNGYLPGSRSAADITVNLYDNEGLATAAASKPASPNCTVTSYGFVDGVVTFTVKPTTNGNGRRLVVFVESPTGSVAAIVDNSAEKDRAVAVNPVPSAALQLDATDTNSYPGSGTTWSDLSGNSNHATLTGASYSAAGAGYPAMYFNGSSNQHASGTLAPNAFSGAHSLLLWCYQTSIQNYATPISNEGGTSGLDFIYQNNPSTPDNDCTLGNSFRGSTTDTPTLTNIVDGDTRHLGRWICISMCNANNTVGSRVATYAYHNGKLFASSGRIPVGMGNYTVTNRYLLGRAFLGDQNFKFVGYIGLVEIYPSQLTLQQYVARFNQTRAKFGVASDIVLSSTTQIHNTNAGSGAKETGFSIDPSWPTLQLAFPGDSLLEYSASLNSLGSKTKTVTVRNGTSNGGKVIGTDSKYYGNSFLCQVATNTTGGSLEFGGLPSNMFNSPFTLEMWFRPTTVQGGSNVIVQIGTSNTQELWVSLPVASSVASLRTDIRAASTQTVSGLATYALSTWHHFALVRDATHFRFYVNGMSDVVRSQTTLPNVTNIWIGGLNAVAASDFYGQIQDVRIYTSVKYPGAFMPTLVRHAYVAPTTADTLTFTGKPDLVSGSECTIKLSGTDFNPVSVVVPRLTVHVFDRAGETTKPGSPNCRVTAYDPSNGVITFKATPATTGPGRRVVVFVDPPDGSAAAVREEPTDLTASGFKIGSLSVRYIRITNITFASVADIWFGKIGLYTSASAAAGDAGSSSDNWLYAKRASVSFTVEGGQSSSANAVLGNTNWRPDIGDYVWLKRETPSRLTIDMGAGNAISESGGLFFRLGAVGIGQPGASRIGIEVSADGSTYLQRKLSWVDGSLKTSDANDWYRESSAPEFGASHPYRYVVMVPAGMMITEPP